MKFFSLSFLQHWVAMNENAVIPPEAEIQGFEIIVVSSHLDARLRGHDELRPGLRGKGGGNPAQRVQENK
jgi:hypothetical protein